MGFLPICAPKPHFQFLRFNSIFYYLVGLDPPHCSFLSFSYLSLHLLLPIWTSTCPGQRKKKKNLLVFFIEIYFNTKIKERESLIILIYKTLACLFYLINLSFQSFRSILKFSLNKFCTILKNKNKKNFAQFLLNLFRGSLSFYCYFSSFVLLSSTTHSNWLCFYMKAIDFSYFISTLMSSYCL